VGTSRCRSFVRWVPRRYRRALEVGVHCRRCLKPIGRGEFFLRAYADREDNDAPVMVGYVHQDCRANQRENPVEAALLFFGLAAAASDTLDLWGSDENLRAIVREIVEQLYDSPVTPAERRLVRQRLRDAGVFDGLQACSGGEQPPLGLSGED